MRSHALVVAFLAFMCFVSCVEREYDLSEGVDGSMTVVPGAGVTLEMELGGVSVGDLLNILSSNAVYDDSGDYSYVMAAPSAGISCAEPSEGVWGSCDGTVAVIMDGVPDFLKGSFYTVVNPRMELVVDNPLGVDVDFSATISAGDRTAEVTFSVPAHAQAGTVDISPQVQDVIRSLDRDVVLQSFKARPRSMSVSPTQSCSVALDAGPAVFNIGASVTYGCSFTPGSAFNFEYSLDLAEQGYDYGALDVETTQAIISLTVTNTLPLTMSFSLSDLSGKASITMDKAVAAGSLDNPVDTDITLTLKSSMRLKDIRGVVLRADAVNEASSAITLNRSQKLFFTVHRISTPSGINVNVDKYLDKYFGL